MLAECRASKQPNNQTNRQTHLLIYVDWVSCILDSSDIWASMTRFMMIHGQAFFYRRSRLIIALIFLLCSIYLLGLLLPSKHAANTARAQHLLLLAEESSFCSKRSARRGFNQHVLSVSAYESDDRIELKTNTTWSYIESFTVEAKKLYPSWIVRVYHYNLMSKTKDDFAKLEQLHENLNFCDVENLPVLGNLKDKLPGKVQRFLPASK